MNNKFCEQCGTPNALTATACLNCGRPFANNAPSNFSNQAGAFSASAQLAANNFAPPFQQQSPPNNFAQPNSNLPTNASAFSAPAAKKGGKGFLFKILASVGLLAVVIVAIPLLQIAEILPKPLFGGYSRSAMKYDPSLEKYRTEPTSANSSSGATNTTGAAISAKELFSAYQTNLASADNKYKGKSVSVSGAIDTTGVNISGKVFALFDVGSSAHSVSCTFPDSAKSTVTALHAGQQATFQCRVEGNLYGDVALTNCAVGN